MARVAGNHEFYGSRLQDVLAELHETGGDLENMITIAGICSQASVVGTSAPQC